MLVEQSHNPALVALALAVCFFSSFTALHLGGRAGTARGRPRLIWWSGGALAMGSAIWSMHFLAMLAFSVGDMAVSYDVGKTIASLVLAIVFSGIGTALTILYGTGVLVLVLSGVLMGFGIAGMHYLGMDAMQMAARISYDATLVAVSLAIAIAASMTALWLTLNLHSLWTRIASALVMCIAIAGMHYTGMAAASYIPMPGAAIAAATPFPPVLLAYGIAVVVILVSALGLVSVLMDEHLARRANEDAERLLKREERFRNLAPTAEHASGMGVFARLKDYHRVIASASVPLILFLVALGVILFGQWQTSSEMRRIERVAAIALTISDLVHELQKERGASAVFIGQEGQGVSQERLNDQRLDTDLALASFNETLDAFNVNAYDAGLADRVADARRRAGQLDAIRSDVSNLSASVSELESHYTSTIASLLDIIGEMAISSTDAEISNQILAYLSFLQAKEQAGVERAIGAGAFGAQQFTPAAHERFIGVVGRQEALLATFREHATAEHLREYESTVSGHVVDEVARMRAIGIANGYGEPIGDITSTYWFDTITAKIDLMKEVENVLVKDLVAIAAAEGAMAQRILILAAVISFLFLAGTAAIILFIVRVVGKSVNENWRIRWEKERFHHLALVAEHTSDMVTIADREGRVEWVNHAFEQHTGYVLSEIRGRELSSFLWGPKSDQAVTGLIASHIRERKAINAALQHYKKDGTPGWVDLTITPIFDEHDELTNYISIERNIAGRVRAQEGLDQALKMLRKEKERYELAVQASADGIWEWNIFDESFNISDHFVKQFGYDSSEGFDNTESIFKIIHPDDLERIKRAIDHHLIRKTPYDVQFRLRHRNGTYRWQRAKGEAVWNKSAEPAHMRGSVSDIHEIKLLTQELQRRTQDLSTALQQNETILQSIREGICGIDLDGIMTFANAAACEMTGFSVDEIIGQHWQTFAPHGTQDRDIQRNAHIHEALTEGRETRSSDQLPIRKDGSSLPIEYTVAPLRGEDGEIAGAIIAFHDISQRKNIEAKREELFHELEQANRLKSEFLANMSHEIRTPMNGVLGMCQHLLRGDLNDDQRECAEVIQISARALLSLINSVLDLAKIEAGLIEPDVGSFRLQDLVQSVIEIVRPTAMEKDLELHLCLSDIGDAYLGDEPRLRQVLLNLVGNAVKFTDQGSVSLSITAVEQQMVQFEITDTGPGIPANYLEGIFDRFTQVDASHARRHGGTGLGLAITKELIELFGGEIHVKSVEGKGSTFWFSIPLARDAPRQAVTVEEGVGGSSLIGRPLRILLAEDNETNRLVAQKLLGELAREMVCVETGAAALEELEKGAFDLVIMDLQMPVMTGDEAIRRIRSSNTSYQDVPIIVLTANAMMGVREEMLAIGADDFVPKPLDIDVLESSIAQIFNRHVNATPKLAG